MLRPLLFVAVASLVLLGGASATVPATADGPLTAGEMCDLYPQDQGYRIEERPAFPACDATRGDCDQPASSARTCVFARISLMTPEQAREPLRGGSSAAGLGESAIESSDERGGYTLGFVRDRYWMSVTGVSGQADAAKALAQHVDRELERVLGAAPPHADAEQPPDAAEDAEPPDDSADPFVDILKIFAGVEGFGEDFSSRVNELTNCPEPKWDQLAQMMVEPSVYDCPGQRPGYEVAWRFDREFDKKITAPSLNEKAMKERLWRAMFMAGMEGPSGEPLFPSIVTAMPVIKRLADLSVLQPADQEEAIGVVQRFVELLAARDAARWQYRFP